MAGRSGDNLKQVKGSQNWYVRLQDGRGKEKSVSLGTPDKELAKVLAAQRIAEHKRFLLTRKLLNDLAPERHHSLGDDVILSDEVRYQVAIARAKDLGMIAEPEYADQERFELPSGEQGVATGDKLVITGLDGTMRIEPNETVFKFPVDMIEKSSLRNYKAAKKAASPNEDPDRKIMVTYYEESNVSANEKRNAENAFALFKEKFDGKRFSKATRKDGKAFVDLLFGLGFKSATVQRKVGYLSAACNVAIGNDELVLNPFSNCMPKGSRKRPKDAVKRAPLSNEDIMALEKILPKQTPDVQLLWHILRWTGMRRSEAWQMTFEGRETGIRYVHIGQKTETSDRMIPIPDGLLPYLPSKIQGCLFESSDPDHGPSFVGKKLLRAMRKAGIPAIDENGRSKVLHSLRHRAQSRLRAVKCQSDIREAILGHEKVTVADGYGKGFPMSVLKPDMDKIGILDDIDISQFDDDGETADE